MIVSILNTKVQNNMMNDVTWCNTNIVNLAMGEATHGSLAKHRARLVPLRLSSGEGSRSGKSRESDTNFPLLQGTAIVAQFKVGSVSRMSKGRRTIRTVPTLGSEPSRSCDCNSQVHWGFKHEPPT